MADHQERFRVILGGDGCGLKYGLLRKTTRENIYTTDKTISPRKLSNILKTLSWTLQYDVGVVL